MPAATAHRYSASKKQRRHSSAACKTASRPSAAPARFEADAAFGARLVEAVRGDRAPARRGEPSVPPPAPATLVAPTDVTVLGGSTGSSAGDGGANACRRAQRRRWRADEGLPPLFSGPRIRLLRGDIADAGAVAQAVAGRGQWSTCPRRRWRRLRCDPRRDGRRGGGRRAPASPRARHRLVHVGSIASLYRPGAGPSPAPLFPTSQPSGAAYARAKAECDQVLLGLHAQEKLPW